MIQDRLDTTCRNCQYVRAVKGLYHGEDEWRCRRFPPGLLFAGAPPNQIVEAIALHVEQPKVHPLGWCGEWQPVKPQNQLSVSRLARLWDVHKRYPNTTVSRIERYIVYVREAIEAGITSEEDVCRVLKCRKNTNRWKIIAEIRSRLLEANTD